jgi:hypothetical protein
VDQVAFVTTKFIFAIYNRRNFEDIKHNRGKFQSPRSLLRKLEWQTGTAYKRTVRTVTNYIMKVLTEIGTGIRLFLWVLLKVNAQT